MLNNRLYQLLFLVVIASLCLYTMVYFSIIRPKLALLKNQNNTTQQAETNSNQPNTKAPASPAPANNPTNTNQSGGTPTTGTNRNQPNSSSTTANNNSANPIPAPTPTTPAPKPVCNEEQKAIHLATKNRQIAEIIRIKSESMARNSDSYYIYGNSTYEQMINGNAVLRAQQETGIAGYEAEYLQKLAQINCT